MTARCAHPACSIWLISRPGSPLPVRYCWKHANAAPKGEAVADRWKRAKVERG